MASEKKIAILGCGWFGLPLAKRLCENGHTVKGSTTDPAKADAIASAGAEPFVVRIEPGENAGAEEFFNSDIVVVNFPPQRRDDIVSYLAGQTQTLVNALVRGGAEFAVFISSTSVYAELGRKATESDSSVGTPSKRSGIALRETERTLADRREFDTTVIRFAGLIGYDRNPREFLKKRAPMRRPNLPVNLIHRDDCVEITARVIERDIRGEIFNAVADFHPLRSEFYKAEAQRAGISASELALDSKDKSGGKIVSGEKLKRTLGYEFIYPDPLSPAP